MDTNTDALTKLQQGSLAIQGEFMWGSNYTFLAQVSFEGETMMAVYKPSRGERPLWDFPTASLARREVAAYMVSKELGWDFVPPTVLREKGPLGSGSLQLYVDHDPDYHYFNFSEEDRQRLRPVVLFDLLVNNADRKGSHILKDPDEHLWLIDHGVCFHFEDKLRTVVWDFVGEPIPERLCANITMFSQRLKDLNKNSDDLIERLQKYLSRGEIRALIDRAETLVTAGSFPGPDPYRRPFPWPQV
jgi:uncharacterized repeat protein (TIGR03843 family)